MPHTQLLQEGGVNESQCEAVPGWWLRQNPSRISACWPASACIGQNLCAENYVQSLMCSTCKVGFFRRGGECHQCPPQDQVTTLVIWALVLLAIYLLIRFVTTACNRRSIQEREREREMTCESTHSHARAQCTRRSQVRMKKPMLGNTANLTIFVNFLQTLSLMVCMHARISQRAQSCASSHSAPLRALWLTRCMTDVAALFHQWTMA